MRAPRLLPSRRNLLSGLGFALAATPWPVPGLILRAETRTKNGKPASGLPYVLEKPSAKIRTLQIRARTGALNLGQDIDKKEVFILEPESVAPLSYPTGTILRVTFTNDLPLPAVLNWYGIDGSPDAAPFIRQKLISTGTSATYDLVLKQAGTVFCQALLPDKNTATALALKVEEPEKQDIDHDEIALIEEFQFAEDSTETAANPSQKQAGKLFTLNRERSGDFTVRANSRARIRFINSSQKSVIAIKIPDHDVNVVAIDSRPAEPYLAHNGQLVLAPGTRIVAVIDATLAPGGNAPILLHDGRDVRTIGRLVYSSEPPIRSEPLPAPLKLSATGLPKKLDLARANRIDLSLDAPIWLQTNSFLPSTQPAFRVRAVPSSSRSRIQPIAQ